MTLVLFIAAIIAMIVAASKAIKALKANDTKGFKTYGIIAIVIMVIYVVVVYIVRKVKGTTTTKNWLTLGNSILDNTKYTLNENEVRSSGKPMSNYDLITNNAIDKAINRITYKHKLTGIMIYVTSDPDYNADKKIGGGFSPKEVYFSEDITLFEDTKNISDTPTKSFSFKKGTIYKANISAPLDSPIGLDIETGKNQSLFFSYSLEVVLSRENTMTY